MTTDPIQHAGPDARFAELQRELAETHARLAEALRGTRAGSWEWNVQTGETRFDERWAEIVGYTLAELGPPSIETWTKLAHPEDLARSREALDRVFARVERFYDIEARMRHRDGSWVWVHDRGTVIEWLPDGRPLRMAGTHTEISERKRAEELLRRSEALYSALFEKSHAVMLLVDPEGPRVHRANRAALEYYGYAAAQMQGLDMAVLNGLTREEMLGLVEQIRAGRTGQYRLRHRRANGEWRDVELFTSPVQVGEHLLLHSIVHDVTDRRLAEQAKFELERQLQQSQKAESLARMAGAVAHLFNNQLQAVLGNLELARMSRPDENESASRLDDALRVTQHAAQLCSLMLSYLGQQQGSPERIDLGEFCRARVHRMRAALRAGVTLDLHESGRPLAVSADPHHLQAVLEHLVTNAAESRDTAPVRIRLSAGEGDPSEAPSGGRFPLDWLPSGARYACLSVSDDGPGIPGGDIERLFDPFFSTKFTGRGMGLPVVLGLVRVHGGGVVVESEPGRGSTFRVYLPALE